MRIERLEYQLKRAEKTFCLELQNGSLNILCFENDETKEELFAAILQSLENHSSKKNCIEQHSRLSIKSDSESLTPFPGAISRETIKTLFHLSSDTASLYPIGEAGRRLSILAHFAGVSAEAKSIDKALSLVEEKLEKYPFHGKFYKIEDLEPALKRGKTVLQERLLQLEQERKAVAVQIEELKILESELKKLKRSQKREEYFQLCLETAELDARIMKVQHRLLSELELKRELAAIGDLTDFPASSARKVDELWTMRQARLSDLDRMYEDLEASRKESIFLENSFKEESKSLETLSIEDAQQLFGISKNLAAAIADREELVQEITQEMRRVKDSGIDFDSMALLRKSILKMTQMDLEEGNKLAVELKWNKDKLAQKVAIMENSGKQMSLSAEELDGFELKSKKLRAILIGLTTVSLLIVIFLHLSKAGTSLEVFSPIFLTSFVLSAIALAALPQFVSGMRRGLSAKLSDLQKDRIELESEEIRLSKKVSEIQERGDELANKYDFASGIDLFKKLNSYSSVSGRLKQLDLLDQMLKAKEQHINSLNREALGYFEKAQRKQNIITASSISGLASEILRFKESLREMERSNAVLNNRVSERRFLEGELNDCDSMLLDIFRRAQLEELEDVEKAFAEFERKYQSYRKWESIKQELKRMATDFTSEIFEQDLATVLSKLQHKRTDAWTKMQALISLYPEVLAETLEDLEIGRLSVEEAEALSLEIQDRETRAEYLREQIRASTKSFDEFHPKTQHELEILERNLARIEHDGKALRLCAEKLKELAEESKSEWARELSEISADLLKEAQLDFSKISWNEKLEISLIIKDSQNEITEQEAEKTLSHSQRIQLDWLLRFIFCKYICRRLALPVILMDPFSELSDRRFQAFMNLIIEKLLPEMQFIILSSQKIRQNWYWSSLPDSLKEKCLLKEL
ncbi:MAG: hypothetical protein K2X27_22815 [Candidatus Obscuribacterales bacterium]|nr:hypothetical protein [Candidatus Obscuribacterales bacterium]